MPNLNVIFEGTTISPVREFVADLANSRAYQRIVLPCVGRFATLTALVRKGIQSQRLWASDFCLFSSLIGYLADPTHTLDELNVQLEGDLSRFTAEAKDDFDQAAGILLALKYVQLDPSNLHVASLRCEIRHNRHAYLKHIREKLQEQVQLIRGIHYQVSDVRAEVDALAAEKDSFLYINLPGYGGGYSRMFAGDKGITWQHSKIQEFHPKEAKAMLSAIPESVDAVAYVHHGRDQSPDSWVALLAVQQNSDRADYLVANHDLQVRHAVERRPGSRPKIFEIYDDQEITAASQVAFVKVDRDTALYYRDLFVHRLGQTNAHLFYLFTIDGRVVTAMGTNDENLLLGKNNYLHEVFGISKTSKRYARMGKLFMLCLTSGDMKRYLLSSHQAYVLREPAGIRTTSITIHEEGKTDRSVMKLVNREVLADGRFHLTYQADFRQDTWSDCLQSWLKRWGNKRRE